MNHNKKINIGDFLLGVLFGISIGIMICTLTACVTTGEYRCYDRCLDLSKEYEAKGYQTDIAFGRVRGRPHCVMMYSDDGIQWHRYVFHPHDRTMGAEFYLNYKVARMYDPEGMYYNRLKLVAKYTR
jgi:hypothetical protein